MDTDRSAKIDKVRKMRALSISEGKLGNKGASETAAKKAQELIIKYSITIIELNEPCPPKQEYKSYASPEEAIREHTRQQQKTYQSNFHAEDEERIKAQQRRNKYQEPFWAETGDSRLDDLMREFARIKRESRGFRSYEEPKKEKQYRYVHSFKCAEPTTFIYTLAKMHKCEVEGCTTVACEWSKTFFYKKITKYKCDFSVVGTAQNLVGFKRAYLTYGI